MFDVYFFIKISLALIALLTIGTFLIRRINSKRNSGKLLKHNISLIRNEKLLMHADKKLEKKRHSLMKKSRSLSNKNQHELINESRKLGISTGEMILASKIQMSLD